LVANLLDRGVNVIAAVGGSPAAVAAKLATTSVPIVFQIGVDPIPLGLVSSLNRPGGNLTGIVNLSMEVGPKRIEILRELIPTATVIAVLVNPKNPVAGTQSQEMQAAARSLGMQVHVLNASTDGEFELVFANLEQLRATGLAISGDPFFNSRGSQLAALALRHNVPAVYQFREFVTAGGLVSYGSSITDAHRIAGVYTGRVLKGKIPADLPVQRSTKIELIINMKTAKALSITVPITLLGRADEVID
jgi:ABC-type uncharacterized transport system substrate-binding protein